MEIEYDQGLLNLPHPQRESLLIRLQRVYFGNWLRDYSQVRVTA